MKATGEKAQPAPHAHILQQIHAQSSISFIHHYHHMDNNNMRINVINGNQYKAKAHSISSL